MDAQLTDGLPLPAGRLFDRSVHDELLRSTVRLTRLTFAAAAASVFLYDPGRDELVFEASSGAGEDQLVGVAIPADHGIAGWVWNTGETIIVGDLDQDTRFNASFAAETGYVPKEIMAAPLEVDKEPIGVIEVLDPQLTQVGEVAAIDLLTELAQQTCAAVSLLVAARRLEPQLRDRMRTDPLSRLETALNLPGEPRAEKVDTFLLALADLLTDRH